ncbi:MAG TPA: LON peptidase substrate-binding domain-containing protein, partial [Anaerolineae bacterium]|nr:LON peptidase substrate-binding domain-containing protein [Anaerolineae bacterium]
MFELPIFPLNTVLFPGMPLSLHIFEDRYKLMIGKCLQERRAFGVVLIRQGA